MTSARGLWLLAALLTLIVAAELFRPVGRKPAALRAGTVAAPSAALAAADPIGEWTAAILARPLFAPDRKPVPPAAAASQTASGSAALPRLAGIIVSPSSRTAIFAGDGESDASTIASVGANLGAWRVTSIAADAVTLAGPDGSRTIKPSYSTAPQPASPAAPPPFAGFGTPFNPAGFPGAFPPNPGLVPQPGARPPSIIAQPATASSGRPDR